MWLNEYSGQFLPILGLLGLRTVVGAGDWLLRRLGREKKSEQEELAEQYGRHRAKEYNVGPPADASSASAKDTDAASGSATSGGGPSPPPRRRDTGVRYADVAGIDAIKEDIAEVLDILVGKTSYTDMGAKPIRVRAGAGGAFVALSSGRRGRLVAA